MKRLVSKISSPGIKKAYRLLRYGNERKRFSREFAIRNKQDDHLRLHYRPDAEKLIIFIVPGSDPATGTDKISGGTMSIVSICEETATLEHIHGAQTIMCTLNDESLLVQHTKFENHTLVYRFEQLHRYFTSAKEVLIHLPEFMVDFFIGNLTRADRQWFKACSSVHVNIMNQNIRLMPDRGVIDRLRQLVAKVTITTAHQRYCTAQFRSDFGVPLHKLSVWISPEQYHFRPWEEKDDLMVVSPDQHPMKDQILEKLGAIHGLELRIIRDLTYQEYKTLISRAKWALTFGEGLDGYFIEPVFSGAVSFAVYNEEFFTPDFGELTTVYPSTDQLVARIGPDMDVLNNKSAFKVCQDRQYELCAYYYSKEQYRNNIIAFYKGAYTYA